MFRTDDCNKSGTLKKNRILNQLAYLHMCMRRIRSHERNYISYASDEEVRDRYITKMSRMNHQSSDLSQNTGTQISANAFYAGIVDSLKPLQVRAGQIQSQEIKDQASRILQWEQSERPVLRDHAVGMKRTMQLLAKEEAALKLRVANLENSSVRNCPGTSTGFNVIRSRVDTCGRPLETEALKSERDRLATALRKFDADIASAKAEIAMNTRKDEIEIWETKLVAMQVGGYDCFFLVVLIGYFH